jgi:hypothetical protein
METEAQQMCTEIINWIQTVLQGQELAALQREISAAQVSGDQALLMELVARKQELVKKI